MIGLMPEVDAATLASGVDERRLIVVLDTLKRAAMSGCTSATIVRPELLSEAVENELKRRGFRFMPGAYSGTCIILWGDKK